MAGAALAVVVLKAGHATTSHELRWLSRRKFAKWQLPEDVVFVPELPAYLDGQAAEVRAAIAVQGLGRRGVGRTGRRLERVSLVSAFHGL